MMRPWIQSVLVLGWISSIASAQDPRTACMSGIFKDSMAPGVVGSMQIERNPRLRGCFQPVEISGPKGLKIALASDGFFQEEQLAPARAAFMIGPVYRLKVTNIPQEEGMELFPTIEVIDRLYPPAEREHRFPIPVVLEQDDLVRALQGEMVTRVIYLEDSEIAEPISYADGIQRVHDLTGTQDALQAADRLGRPMAILRIGSRVPDATTGVDNQFLYGCPPWVAIKEIPNRAKLIQSQGWPEVEIPKSNPQDKPIAPLLEAKRPFPARPSAATGRLGG